MAKIWHTWLRKKQPKAEINKEADCGKCKHSRPSKVEGYDLVCDAKNYDTKTLQCFERKEGV